MKTLITELPERDDFLQGVRSTEIGYPWLTPGSIMALELILTLEFNVLELGTGGSTIFWSRRCKTVKSLETEFEWIRELESYLPKLPNVVLVYGEMVDLLETIKYEPTEFYDLILVDSDPVSTDRLVMANAVVPKLKKGGWLVIDNYNEWGMEKFKYSDWLVYTFDDFGWAGFGTRICQKK